MLLPGNQAEVQVHVWCRAELSSWSLWRPFCDSYVVLLCLVSNIEGGRQHQRLPASRNIYIWSD